MTYKVFRGFLASVLALVAILPLVLYVVLSSDYFQHRVKGVVEQELTKALGAPVAIGSLEIAGLNQLTARSVEVKDDYGQDALCVDRLGAGFDTWQFIWHQRLVVDYVHITGMNARLYRQAPGEPLNIQGIIDHLKPKDQNKPPTRFDLKVNTLAIDGSMLQYDVLSMPETPQKFNPNHICISQLQLLMQGDRISNSEIDAVLEKLAFVEQSGFAVNQLSGAVKVSASALAAGPFTLDLPNSHLELDQITEINAEPTPDKPFAWLSQLYAVRPIHVLTPEVAQITPADFQAFVPALATATLPVDLSVNLEASAAKIDIETLTLRQPQEQIFVNVQGQVVDYQHIDQAQFDLKNLALTASGTRVADYLTRDFPQARGAADALRAMGLIELSATGAGTTTQGNVNAQLKGHPGALDVDMSYAIRQAAGGKEVDVDGQVSTAGIQLARLLPQAQVGYVRATAQIEGTLAKKDFLGTADVDIDAAEYRGYTYRNVKATAVSEPDNLTFSVASDDPNARFDIHGATTALAGLSPDEKSGHVLARIYDLDLNTLNLWGSYPGYRLSGDVEFDFAGGDPDTTDAELQIENFAFAGSEKELALDYLNVSFIHSDPEYKHIDIASDVINGTIEGKYSIKSLGTTVRDLLSDVFPAYLPEKRRQASDDDIVLRLTMDQAENISDFFGLPMRIIYPVDIMGHINGMNRSLTLDIDAPYLQQGNKIVEDTSLHIDLDGNEGNGKLFATTQMYTKKGLMPLIVTCDAHNNIITTNFDWSIERAIPINGNLALTTQLSRSLDNQFQVEVQMHPGTINFGETVWHILPSTITYHRDYLNVNCFGMTADTQSVTINGTCTKVADDQGMAPFDNRLTVNLDRVNLIEIFETLEIDKAMLSGQATGTLYVSNLFDGGMPAITSPGLHVKDIGYNRCTLGDADILAHWDNDKQSFALDAVVNQPNGRQSIIGGDIFPMCDSLDITFTADRVNIGFMRPFMEAFTSDVSGEASGRAHLWGNFKYIDLEGDIFADSLRMKVDFTNTYYTALRDSIHIVPGLIDIKNVPVYDVEGHQAMLNGFVKHTFFKDPVFDFRLTDAKDFLSYDVTEKLSPVWYGKIYGNGSAFITGEPGVVNIDVNMATAKGSTFTFVLSDLEEAGEYSFITFRDLTPKPAVADSLIHVDDTPQAVKDFYQSLLTAQAENPSRYNMNIQVDVNPEAQMVIVMDPIGGDRILAYGSGNLRLTYDSANEDLKMWGTYALDRGKYNFTFQDIILKDFTINEGSSIAFHGDPYSAQLDIEAVYAVNANLSDLDESFLQDKDLNRTRVPVHAVLKAKGDMRQPEIAFDLDFPTLQSDTYRKVRSIISTEDMMNRQIIYLLALNRFYTPEYMQSTTKGDELFSVASSTITSQLGNMLGQLSENWSIAPNLRSDNGDFSDVEVDLALSSSLLNNRLLFNGNFGYRDKSLNTNQFIGDFDIEYLLNPKGTWRLKAYNRYNDQNYYLRSAATTQGIGIMTKRDFDNIFTIFRRSKKAADKGTATDTIKAPADSISVTADTLK